MIKALRIDKRDNVVIAIEPVAGGETIIFKEKDNSEESLEVLENITVYHKIAAEDIEKGGRVLKYGEVIGKALCDIPRGSHVHTHNIASEKE